MASLIIDRLLVLNDNYIFLLHEPDSGTTAVVDPAEAAPVSAALKQRGWRLTHILNTHHHHDHTGGNLALKAESGCTIIGAADDAARIPGLDHGVRDGDVVRLGGAEAQVLEVPGHTSGHVAYWFAADQAVFCGDTLFSLGCGRMFEGTPAGFWHSLSRLRALPPETRVFCAHEYTESNLRFAESVDPGNPALTTFGERVRRLRAAGEATVPSRLADECAANPFLRADDPALVAHLGLGGCPPDQVFATLRQAKDRF